MRDDVLVGAAAVLCALLIGSAAGCASSQPVCSSAATCPKGTICVAGRCRPKKEVPAPASSQRVVLEPTAVSLVSSKGGDGFGRADAPFGKRAAGDVVLLLRFPAPFNDTTEILSAFVVMDPAPGAIPGPGPVELRIARILEPWSPEHVSWTRLPSLSGIESTFLASTWAGRELRLEVTDQVRRWRQHRADDQGLAVLASPQNDVGATYSLGLAEGRGPRLDVYLR